MSRYKRNFQKGGTYFFTVNLSDRSSHLLIDHIALLKQSVLRVKKQWPFVMPAWVILPEHIHCIWTLPENDFDYSSRWRSLKSRFSKNLPKQSAPVWQNRYWEHTIRSQSDFNAHMDYIHINPVKHGHVNKVQDWPYSSFHFWVSKGVYNPGWAGDMENHDPETVGG